MVGTVERKELPSNGGVLEYDGPCRSLSSIAVGTSAGNGLVRVGGDTDSCSGCKNISSLDVIYEWNGEVLTPTQDFTY